MKIPASVIQWLEPEQVALPDKLRAFCGSDFLAACLVRRGIRTVEQARSFLDSDQYQPASPLDLPDLGKGALRIWQAIQRQECIGVWGDFDVDGQTSTTLLVSVLRQLGGNVIYHIPVRASESHGINLPNLKTLIERGAQVVLTCDTGITAFEAADYCRENNIDLVITDHHTLGLQLPDAFAVINPQRLPEDHPLRTIPGVGAAYVFSQELTRLAGRPELADKNLDLVALGTVADVATLVQDARYHVQRGLRLLRAPQRAGLRQLYRQAEVNAARFSEEQIGFMVGPRMNALGRLADANPIVEFLTTQDEQNAAVFAAQLEGYNAERKFLTDEVFKSALAQLEAEPALAEKPALILAHPQWPGGVIGIVASRLVELFNRPVILLAAPPDHPMHGSARSVDGVNITSAIAAAREYLQGFGGHPMAAGLSFEADKFNPVRRKIWADITRQQTEQPFQRALPIEAYLKFEDLSFELAEQIEQLAPFGPGNPAPTLATRNLRAVDIQQIGKKEEHLKVLVEDENGQSRNVLWWHGDPDLVPQQRFDLAYTLRANDFRGQTQLQLEWKGYRLIADQTAEVRHSGSFDIIDLRQDPLANTAILAAAEKGALCWGEGPAAWPDGLTVVNRTQLSPAPALLILSAPPDRAVLQEALTLVHPEQVLLASLGTPQDQFDDFMKHLSALIRYALVKYSGVLNFNQLAAICGHSPRTVQSGIEWLVSRGNIRLIETSQSGCVAAAGGVPNPDRAEQLRSQINNQLEETASFRKFYLRAAPQQILLYP
jgi:single-stranded-DNA-specific exonuclease